MLYKMVLILFVYYKSSSVTILMKASEQHFPLGVGVIMLYNVVKSFVSVYHKSWSVTVEIKATEQWYVLVVHGSL